MKWVTRANVKVDRVACPWLIRTFVDPEAEFLFVPVDQVDSVVKKTSAIPYDTAGAELGHHGDECSFDAIVKKYKIKRRGHQSSGGHRAWCRYKATRSDARISGS